MGKTGALGVLPGVMRVHGEWQTMIRCGTTSFIVGASKVNKNLQEALLAILRKGIAALRDCECKHDRGAGCRSCGAAQRELKLVSLIATRSPELRLGLSHSPEFEIERHGSSDEVLQGRLVDLLAFVNVDGAPNISLEAGVE